MSGDVTDYEPDSAATLAIKAETAARFNVDQSKVSVVVASSGSVLLDILVQAETMADVHPLQIMATAIFADQKAAEDFLFAAGVETTLAAAPFVEARDTRPEVGTDAVVAAPTPTTRVGEGNATSFPVTLPYGEVVWLPRSTAGELLTLSLAPPAAMHRYAVPTARSYDGHAWEAVQPALELTRSLPIVAALLIACEANATGCIVPSPPDSSLGGWTYMVHRYNDTASRSNSPVAQVQASKMLTQATFGPTMPQIQSLAATVEASGHAAAMRQWVDGQMAANATSLRAYYRRRTQPRVIPRQNLMAGVELPSCAAGSRWHRYALTTKDMGKQISISLSGGVVTVAVNGELRTKVARSWGTKVYQSSSEQGFKGGTCTCPDGSVWLVSERTKNDCTSGLRCYGGTASACEDQPDVAAFYSNNQAGFQPSDLPFADLSPLGGSEAGSPAGQDASFHYITKSMECAAGFEGRQPDDNAPINLDSFPPGAPYTAYICFVSERVGGLVQLHPNPGAPFSAHGCAQNDATQSYMTAVYNPPVDFADGDTSGVRLLSLGGDDATLSPLSPPTEGRDATRVPFSYDFQRPGGKPDVVLLGPLAGGVSCSLGLSGTLNSNGSHFLTRNGTYYRRDVRLQTVDNDVDVPAALTAVDTQRRAVCPKVKKSFLNMHGCRREPSCAPPLWSSASLTLDEATLRAFYEQGSVLLYVLRDVPLDASRPALNSPCYGGSVQNDLAMKNRDSAWALSRWRKLGACAGVTTTALDAQTASCLGEAILNSSHPARGADFINIQGSLGWQPNHHFPAHHTNPLVRDVLVESARCTACDPSASTVGAIVDDGQGTCWQHVSHWEEMIFDLGSFSRAYEGNLAIGTEGMEALARAGSIFLNVTEMLTGNNYGWSRWVDHIRLGEVSDKASDDPHRHMSPFVGTYMDPADFKDLPATVQLPDVATHFGSTASAPADAALYEQCGSPGEVASDPALGHHFQHGPHKDRGMYEAYRTLYGSLPNGMNHGHSKSTVHTSALLDAPDQLRQKVAWALSQVYVVSVENGDLESLYPESEMWLVFYDIFTRNAFGSLRDVLREVAYSLPMATYLTFLNSKAQAYQNQRTPADENFAREFMQLFSIGVFALNQDGTRKLSTDGAPVALYDDEDTASMARAWTGFVGAEPRSNIENLGGLSWPWNRVDPLSIDAEFRDRLPKMDLYRGHIGDGYPLCADLPAKAWLRKGATYRMLGTSAEAHGFDSPQMWDSKLRVHWKLDERSGALFTPNATHSQLYGALCDRQGGDASACTFPSEVVLPGSLTCLDEFASTFLETDPWGNDATLPRSNECKIEEPRVVCIVDAVSSLTVYYEYVRPPCVELTFFSGGRKTQGSGAYAPPITCADPATTSAGAVCCASDAGSFRTQDGYHNCMFHQERVTHANAATRCAGTAHPHVCPEQFKNDYYCGVPIVWLSDSCELKAQIRPDGRVSLFSSDIKNIVGEGASYHDWYSTPEKASASDFRVRWEDGAYPNVGDGSCNTSVGCNASVTNDGADCVCALSVSTAAGFADASLLPSAQQVVARLHIGAPSLDTYSVGEYTLCATAACQAAAPSVQLYLHSSTVGSGTLNEQSIFRVHVPGNGTSAHPRVLVLLNRVSTVRTANTTSSYAFRNPPRFMSMHEATARDAAYETEALIDHLFLHENTAPTIAITLATHLTTSNPSPRYVRAMVDAFTSGSHGNHAYSGRYGDLGALVAAALLDREASSTLLDADPSHGRLREPYNNLLHAFRALDFRSLDAQAVQLLDLALIGQRPFHAPSVFNFFERDHRPIGTPIGDALLIGPEMELRSQGPLMLKVLNGLFSLAEYGLSRCADGFGVNPSNPDCRHTLSGVPVPFVANFYVPHHGQLHFRPSANDATTVVDELALVLTTGRVSPHTRLVIEAAYNTTLAAEGSIAALKVAQKLFFASTEFHATNFNFNEGGQPRGGAVRPAPAVGTRGNSSFKAVVVVYLYGGLDSYNVLVPHSNCVATAGGYAEYQTARGAAAVSLGSLRQINASASLQVQPCQTMGLSQYMPKTAAMYDQGEAGVFANIGTLIEPLDPSDLAMRNPRTSKRVPRAIGSHNDQHRETQTLSEDPFAKGVLGRILRALDFPWDYWRNATSYETASFSTIGYSRIIDGGPSAQRHLSSDGSIRRFKEKAAHSAAVANLTGVPSSSVFGETHAQSLQRSIDEAELIGDAIDAVSTTTHFSGTIGAQLKSVARVIKARQAFQLERAAFVVGIAGNDAHAWQGSSSVQIMQDVDNAVDALRQEMELEGLWSDGITVVTVSEFGRSIVSNGRGTDHAWAGNHLIYGGALNGGKIWGKYPNKLGHGSERFVRGKMVPTLPWESMWEPIAEWMGVTDARDMEVVVPNAANFGAGARLTKADVYK